MPSPNHTLNLSHLFSAVKLSVPRLHSPAFSHHVRRAREWEPRNKARLQHVHVHVDRAIHAYTHSATPSCTNKETKIKIDIYKYDVRGVVKK